MALRMALVARKGAEMNQINKITRKLLVFTLALLVSACSGSGGGSAGRAPSPSSDKSTGVNGSLARITIVNDYLYLLAGETLKTVSIVDHLRPTYVNATELGPDIETLYPHDAALFVGGRNGVQIVDISMPDDPRLISNYQHAWQCDPVVVNGDIAYVTLRTGTGCQRGDNQLDILDVSDLSSPKLIKSYAFDNPNGLAIDGTTLFIADGTSGLKIFDAQDPFNLLKIEFFPGKHSEDIVLYEKRAYVIGKNGLYQYDYSVLGAIDFLSHLPVVR